jgi:uncharacterized protein (TIGR02145 family)
MIRYLYLIILISLILTDSYSQETKITVRKFEEGVTHITDIPNNKKYNIVKIGDNVWTSTSLWNRWYKDGKLIKRIYSSSDWLKTSEGAYGTSERSKENTYGYVYNGFAIETGKLCPDGWRVARRIDYINLQKLLDTNDLLKSKYSYIVDTTEYDIKTPRVVRCIQETKEN